MIQIKSLANTGIDSIYKAFTEAFADYTEPVSLTEDGLKHMIERRGYNAALSFGAFVDEKMVGFTLNGLGDWNGLLTAYDTGTGVIRQFRQQGVASLIFNESMPVLRKHGVTQYLLEVIKTNTNAVDLYKKYGFRVVREFDYFEAQRDRLKNSDNRNNDYEIKVETNADWKLYQTFWDFQPSWQNSIDSITRKRDGFTLLTAYYENSLIGYGFIERSTGDIPQLAVSLEFRRKGVATELFANLLDYSESSGVKVINTCKESPEMACFFKKYGFKQGYGQFEMIIDL